eukprot:TRINITY_DN28916_c0_g1_i2.p1 TRINITY_DN28916_c0_g1~~TRINITY_DN28916_c0_g1_i2.p1  ORF type:complete len:107 (+),score=3.09 TRINITY_DN28916_c0_g1_i2:158-478(+)
MYINWRSLWSIKALPRVAALLGRILTMDNLRRRGLIIVNACPICFEDEESIDHLLNCPIAQHLWRSTLGWFHVSPQLSFFLIRVLKARCGVQSSWWSFSPIGKRGA